MVYKNILLIDDNADDQKIFVAAVNQVSADIICTVPSNASPALEQINTMQLKPDLLFLDLNMPVMNGQQFMFEFKKNAANLSIPIIVFSTSYHLPTIQLMKSMGAIDFITKPEGFNERVQILTGILMKD
jgi:CheY-like chemotaxis protein